VERHFDQPLISIFRGAGRACRATRGVVMALARFGWDQSKLTFATVGNIQVRVLSHSEPVRFRIRRGIIGANAPNPVVTEHHWDPSNLMALHSDGLTTRWQWEDFPHLLDRSATEIAQELLRALAKDNDDATVVVVRSAT
jgi:serine/threonine protein phosphatase PrpC